MPFCPKNKKRLSYCHGYRGASNVSLRSVLILCRILHVETMFGNEGEGNFTADVAQQTTPKACLAFSCSVFWLKHAVISNKMYANPIDIVIVHIC